MAARFSAAGVGSAAAGLWAEGVFVVAGSSAAPVMVVVAVVVVVLLLFVAALED